MSYRPALYLLSNYYGLAPTPALPQMPMCALCPTERQQCWKDRQRAEPTGPQASVETPCTNYVRYYYYRAKEAPSGNWQTRVSKQTCPI